jgi:hypothetical protein
MAIWHATGSLEKVSSLPLIAEVVVKLSGSTLISAVTCLLAAYYVFNAEYPKGAAGLGKTFICPWSIFFWEGLVKLCQSVLRTF